MSPRHQHLFLRSRQFKQIAYPSFEDENIEVTISDTDITFAPSSQRYGNVEDLFSFANDGSAIPKSHPLRKTLPLRDEITGEEFMRNVLMAVLSLRGVYSLLRDASIFAARHEMLLDSTSGQRE